MIYHNNSNEHKKYYHKYDFFYDWEYTDIIAFLKIAGQTLPKDMAARIRGFARGHYTERAAKAVDLLLEPRTYGFEHRAFMTKIGEERHFIVLVLRQSREIVCGYLKNIDFPPRQVGRLCLELLSGTERVITLADIAHFDLRK